MLNIHSIQSRLVFYLLAVIGGVFLFQALYLSPRIKENATQNAREVQEAAVTQIAEGLDATFQYALSELEAMAALPDIRSLDRERMDRAIHVLNASKRFFNYYFVMDREGRWLSYVNRPELVGQSIPRENMDWVDRTFSENRTIFMDVVQARTGSLVSGFSTPVRGDDGQPVALLRGVILVSEENVLLRFIRNVKVGKSGFAFLLSSNGQLLAHPEKSLQVQRPEQPRPQDRALAKAALRGESGSTMLSEEGHPWMVAYHPVFTTGWAVVVKQSMEDILAAARREARLNSLILVASFFLGLLVAVFVVKTSLRPLAALVRQIRAGRVDTTDKVYPKDEIGQLARQYDEVYTSLFASRERLQQSEAKFRTLFNSASDGLVILDLKGRILEVNQVACEQWGYTREEVLRMAVADLDAQEHRDQIEERIQGVLEKGQLIFETAHVTKDGTTIPLEVSARHIEFEGQPSLLCILRNLTERKEAERALRESEEKYRLLVEKQQDLVVKVDLQGRFLFVSPSYCDMFDMQEEELLGKSFMPLVHEEDRESTEKAMEALFHPPHTAYMEQRARTRHGWRWLAWADTAILDDQGQVTAIHGVGRDITDQKRIEQALRWEKERFQVLVEASPFGVVLSDDHSVVQYVNPRFTELFGYDLEDIPTTDAWFRLAYPDPAFRSRVLSIWQQDISSDRRNRTSQRVFAVRCKDGSSKEVHFRLVHLQSGGLLVFLEDITQQKRLEKQFFQAQKMEAVGTLAEGIAHDFNNLLMGIQGRISLILSSQELPPSHREHLQGVEEYVRSASDLTRQLLGIAQGGKHEVRPIDLNGLVKKSADMFGRTRKEIRLHQKLAEYPLRVEVDPGQIEQVLLNLYVNAWQAMPAGGDLFLETRAVRLDEREVEPYGLDPGDYVLISVTDTGVGMEKRVQERIFDPFFTTKGMGRGTGLGLASAYGIIKNHSGFIRVYSEKGQGTTFYIYLPATAKAVQEEPSKETGVRRGKGRVLLVDDEKMILDVGSQMLESLGYEVITASGGNAAVQMYQERLGEIDLVILDLIMPDLHGGETFDRLKAIHPGVRVLLSSGYSINGKATEILNRGCLGFLQKPFDLEELSRRIAEAIKD
jgi:two-component system, cell cycle sensor histidine kinase and response regulator CckA